ncbi:hypothetical protein chiPu_0004629 [Chiloscyllium punctatum]|uniref:Uncharacterized protein n=1 Tax=Chiloscyllium punctatum TaxID=137246 RepID=A0A401S749_CHIPU|nr:hypothetical protein [Chiloscyllium punctatum]
MSRRKLPSRYYHWNQEKGCMLCFGQSTFFRFNHPAEASRMKSMMSGNRNTPVSYCHSPDSASLVNGNHQTPLNEGSSNQLGAQVTHSSLVSSIEKDLQDIMDSLVMDDATSPGKKQTVNAQSPLSPMVNGGGRYLLSPPLSPGAMSVGSSYDNMSPPFSPLSSPSAASSSSYTSYSPGSQEQAPLVPPTVPVRSSSYNHTVQPPGLRPGPNYSGAPTEPGKCNGLSPGSQRMPDSPRAHRKGANVQETPPSPTVSRRAFPLDSFPSAVPSDARKVPESPKFSHPSHNVPSVSVSPSSGGPRVPVLTVPGSPRFGGKSHPIPSPRSKVGGSLQERPPSPFREVKETLMDRAITSSPSKQMSPRVFQPVESVGLAHVNQPVPLHPRNLQPSESPRLARRSLESMRDLPPLSPSMSRKASPHSPFSNLPTSPHPRPCREGVRHETPPPQGKVVKETPESPRLRRKHSSGSSERSEDFSSHSVPGLSLLSTGRRVRDRSPSPTLLSADLPRKVYGSSVTPAHSLTSLAVSTPLQSPRLQRKTAGDERTPVTRQRKNSISEISDNEDELLDYHRRQREERIREQEMQMLERQRLETILNLCAEYTKTDVSSGPDMGRVTPHSEQLHIDEQGFYPRVADSAPTSTTNVSSRGTSMERSGTGKGFREQVAEPHPQKPREALERSEEENLKEECSSTESTHHEHEDSAGSHSVQQAVYLEEQRLRILASVDELKQRIKELDQQLEESNHEAEMERALLQGERESEVAQIRQEQEIIAQLEEKLSELESNIQREKEKERVKLDAEEREVQRLQSHCHELKSQLDNCPESMREQLQDHLKREVETLESEAKLFEDLEFQQLEKESRLEEERETVSQQLQQDKAEYQRSAMRRKDKVSALENQANQIRYQALQECERLTREKNAMMQLLQKEKDKLANLEKQYFMVTGGKTFSKVSTALKEEMLHITEPSDILEEPNPQHYLPGKAASLFPSPSIPAYSKIQEEYMKLADVFKFYSDIYSTRPDATFCASALRSLQLPVAPPPRENILWATLIQCTARDNHNPRAVFVDNDIPCTVLVDNDIPSAVLVVNNIPSAVFVDNYIPSTVLQCINIPSAIIVDNDFPSTVFVDNYSPSAVLQCINIRSAVLVDNDFPSAVLQCDNIPSAVLVDNNIPGAILVDNDIPSAVLQCNNIPNAVSVDKEFPSAVLQCNNIPSAVLVDNDIPSAVLVDNDIPSAVLVDNYIPSTVLQCINIPSAVIVDNDIPSAVFVDNYIPSTVLQCINIPSAVLVDNDFPSAVFVDNYIPSTVLQCINIPSAVIFPVQ